MKNYDATEQAYKNGYKQGRADAIKEYNERAKAESRNELVYTGDLDQIAKEMGYTE